MFSGCYGTQFFGYSASNTLSNSRRIFGLLEGDFSKAKSEWRGLAEGDKRAYLLECHEGAHHALLSSTPCGLLLWRLNQVIFRDISWLESEVGRFKLPLPLRAKLRDIFFDPSFTQLFIDNGCPARVAEYIGRVCRNLENCLLVREIFFSSGISLNSRCLAMSIGELNTRLRDACRWMGERCATEISAGWQIKGSPQDRVFSRENPINAHDIAEAHALAHELSLIRSFHDMAFFEIRKNEINEAFHNKAFNEGRKGIPEVYNTVFSPSIMRHRSILSFCTGIGLDCSEEVHSSLFIEENLPWSMYQSEDALSGHNHASALQHLEIMVTKQVHSGDSKWNDPADGLDESTSYINKALFLGLDLQIYSFHRNAEYCRKYVIGYLEKNDRAYDQLVTSAINSLCLVEYSDSLFVAQKELGEVYKEKWLSMKEVGFDIFDRLPAQAIAYLVNGALCRNTIARFEGLAYPSSKNISQKLRHFLSDYYQLIYGDVDELEDLVNPWSQSVQQQLDLCCSIEGFDHLVNDDAEFFIY